MGALFISVINIFLLKEASMGLSSVESGLMVHLQRELYDLEVSDFNEKWNITDNEASIIMNWFQIRIDELREKEKL